ncbi:MAG: hypothetical protein JXA93_08985 [Anaerolineae bacterium]|nr:hypothetical protein [Anaerolineae bacterium]
MRVRCGWLWLLTAVLLLGACGAPPTTPLDRAVSEPTGPQSPLPSAKAGAAAMPTATQGPVPTEQPITAIPLAGPAAGAEAEFSGLAWYGDTLVLLPQYPARFEGGADGALLGLERADILAYLDGDRDAALEPSPIPFAAPGLDRSIEGFEGYEAVVFYGDQVFLTIEASGAGGMQSYVVAGMVAPGLTGIEVEVSTLTEIPQPAESPNKSDEGLLIAGDEVVALYEANGVVANQAPVAHCFTLDLAPAGTLPFPAVEYRVTDATALDGAGRFWVINYFFPGEPELKPAVDPIARKYGRGPTHGQYEYVERLIELQLDGDGIHLVDRPPIQLALVEEDARNWEGIARLDGRGFMLVTDKFPETILAFVAGP